MVEVSSSRGNTFTCFAKFSCLWFTESVALSFMTLLVTVVGATHWNVLQSSVFLQITESCLWTTSPHCHINVLWLSLLVGSAQFSVITASVLISCDLVYSWGNNAWEQHCCLQVCSRSTLFCYWRWRRKWGHLSHSPSRVLWCSWPSP
jgi:hypothetical protein